MALAKIFWNDEYILGSYIINMNRLVWESIYTLWRFNGRAAVTKGGSSNDFYSLDLSNNKDAIMTLNLTKENSKIWIVGDSIHDHF